MSSIGKISLDLNVNSKGFNKQVNNIEKKTTKAFGSMSVAVGNIISNLVSKAISSVGRFVKESINKGSELSELQNVVDTVFTTMSDKVESFSKKSLESYGLTEIQSKKMMGTFGAMSKAFGFTEAKAYDMSASLTGLAGDVASFYNLTHDEAYTKLKSVFTGETESLKELGVVMTQAALDEFALAKGINKTTSEMSEREKVSLRLAFVQDRLSHATGDFARTQSQWANQTRILTGQWESFKAAIGQGFINILTPVINALNTLMAKLVQAANAFKRFTEMITGRKSTGAAGEAMKQVAEAANSAAGSTGGIEDAAEGAAEAANKARKSLMGFDEINKLTSNPQQAGSGGGSGLGFDDTLGEVVTEELDSPVLDQTNKKLEKMMGLLESIIKLMKKGFKEGLGPEFNESLKEVNTSLTNIKSSIKDILNDPEVVNSATRFINNISTSAGKIAGSFVRIGMSISENLLGGLSIYLDENKGFIKEKLVSIFDIQGEVWVKISELTEAFASIFDVFRGDKAKRITADIISIFGNVTLTLIELSAKLGRDLVNLIAQPIIDNKDKIKLAIENTLGPISEVTSTVSKSVKESMENMTRVYDEKIQPMFQSFADGLSSIVSKLTDSYNNHFAPVLDNLGNKFSTVWTEHIHPMIQKLIEFIGKVAETIELIWSNVLVPFINWIIETIVPVFAPIIETLNSLLMDFLGVMTDVTSNIIDALSGLIDFVVGVFTADWKKVWEGIKTFFIETWNAIKEFFKGTWEFLKGVVTTTINAIKSVIVTVFNAIKDVVESVWGRIKTLISTTVGQIKTNVTAGFTSMKSAVVNVITQLKNAISSVFDSISSKVKSVVNSIASSVQSMANGVVSAINTMISAMNNLSFDVPDWVPGIGGESFGFDIPKLNSVSIPKLAEGGYVRANQPQPVIVGDNKTQGEIITPENKMLAVMLEALKSFFGQLQKEGYGSGKVEAVGDIAIPIYLDGTLLDEVIVTAQERRNIRSGGR